MAIVLWDYGVSILIIQMYQNLADNLNCFGGNTSSYRAVVLYIRPHNDKKHGYTQYDEFYRSFCRIYGQYF